MKKRKPNKNKKPSTRKAIVLSTIILSLLATFAVAYYNIPALKAKEINGTVLKGVLSKNIIFPNITEFIVAPGQTFTFDVQLQYTDKDGKTAQGEIEDKSDLVMKFSDVALCDRPSYNTIAIKSTAESGKMLKVTLKYGGTEKVYNFIIAYNLKDTINENGIVTNPSSTAVLINDTRLLASDYAPSNLRQANIKYSEDIDSISLRDEVTSAAEKMFTAARKSSIILIAMKGYDTNTSDPEHQTGLAMDISNVDYITSSRFGSTIEGQWVAENAYKYGFIIRYPSGKEGFTGRSYSPTHLRYVGVDLATYLYNNNLTLEEFFSR